MCWAHFKCVWLACHDADISATQLPDWIRRKLHSWIFATRIHCHPSIWILELHFMWPSALLHSSLRFFSALRSSFEMWFLCLLPYYIYSFFPSHKMHVMFFSQVLDALFSLLSWIQQMRQVLKKHAWFIQFLMTQDFHCTWLPFYRVWQNLTRSRTCKVINEGCTACTSDSLGCTKLL